MIVFDIFKDAILSLFLGRDDKRDQMSERIVSTSSNSVDLNQD